MTIPLITKQMNFVDNRIDNLPADITKDISKFAQNDIDNFWTWTKQDQTAFLNRVVVIQNDCLHKQNFVKRYESADFNDNKVINIEEWLEFLEGINDSYTHGLNQNLEKTDNELKVFFDVLNKITPNNEGLSIEDIEAGFVCYTECLNVLSNNLETND